MLRGFLGSFQRSGGLAERVQPVAVVSQRVSEAGPVDGRVLAGVRSQAPVDEDGFLSGSERLLGLAHAGRDNGEVVQRICEIGQQGGRVV